MSLVAGGAASAATLPAGYTDSLVAMVAAPTALAFTPDGRILIASQGGQLRIVWGGALLVDPALDMTAAPSMICVQSGTERGLLGVAVDPDFATNGFVYLFYTADKGTCVNRVSRFTLTNNQISRASELVLADNIPSIGTFHNGGDIHFGRDGLLYISVGDSGCSLATGQCQDANENARRLDLPVGKILRIAKDGSIPPDNPYALALDGRHCTNPTGVPQGTGPCMETYAWGLRNPFRFAFRPQSDEFFINDVGGLAWEEINRGQKNADYGWNQREGRCLVGSTTNCPPPLPSQVDPLFAYARAADCSSITGGAFVPPYRWSSSLAGRYLFADFICGRIFSLTQSAGGSWAASEFATAFGVASLTSLRFGIDADARALFYTTYARGGEVRRIDYTGVAPGPASDLDGDVTSDIVWRHATTGVVSMWQIEGGSFRSTLGSFGVSTDWTIQAVGDFNGDGRADLLWRQVDTGAIGLWLMDDGAVVGTAGWAVPTDWTVQRIGDFNGDGKADILWRQTGTGAVSIWLMDGSAILGPGGGWVVSTDWTIQQVGDFDGNGKADILWRQTSTGITTIWLMGGGSGPVPAGGWTVSADWTIQQVGDLNSDGKTDILWRHTDSGIVSAWLMNGGAVLGSGSWAVSKDWAIRRLGDFNGDGRADILWRHVDSGTVSIWLMEGTSVHSLTGGWAVPNDWVIE